MNGPVLLVGPAERDEFRAIVELLQARGRLIMVRDTALAAETLSGTPQVELVLVAPACREQFPSIELQQLVRLQPLAEWWFIVGPWLEGETRSGRPWPGGRRFYPDQALAELRRRVKGTESGNRPATGWLPPTLSSEERWLVAPLPWAPINGGVRICSELPETRQTLMTVCSAMGLMTVAHGPDTTVEAAGVDAVIYDGVASRDRWWPHVERLAATGPKSLIVLLNFPRPDETSRMLASGATDVLGKPLRIDDLRGSLIQGLTDGPRDCASSVESARPVV